MDKSHLPTVEQSLRLSQCVGSVRRSVVSLIMGAKVDRVRGESITIVVNRDKLESAFLAMEAHAREIRFPAEETQVPRLRREIRDKETLIGDIGARMIREMRTASDESERPAGI